MDTAQIAEVRDNMSAAEWQARCELACAYRLFDHFGWHELIYNHITLRLPDQGEVFLINPFGLMYREVKASNLVKIDIHGNILDGSAHPINRAGFVVHSAVHAVRPDAQCVMHTHTTAGMAVACQKEGLLPLSFPALFFTGGVAYHDFEGITLDVEECERLARSLGNKRVMILRNHGLLACGTSVANAFAEMYHLQRACEVQLTAQSAGAALITPGADVAEKVRGQFSDTARNGPENALLFSAMRRWMETKDPSFAS
jgi:ribulose-5-phosphate 4-epimerase/fuculose-1-phosphate aldolase